MSERENVLLIIKCAKKAIQTQHDSNGYNTVEMDELHAAITMYEESNYPEFLPPAGYGDITPPDNPNNTFENFTIANALHLFKTCGKLAAIKELKLRLNWTLREAYDYITNNFDDNLRYRPENDNDYVKRNFEQHITFLPGRLLTEDEISIRNN